jgi:aryl-alcohol dehydrogenase-like predicted oxidoreductase
MQRQEMRYSRLGKSNLTVSALCLGTMMFGDQTDAAEAQRIVADAREIGVNFIDTADVYTQGAAERIVGQCLAAERDRWVLASKVGNSMGDGPNRKGYSRSWIMRAVEDSLSRLATDYLDIYYLHRDFEGENLEEAVWAMGDLIRAGKIRYFGLSNFKGWRITQVVSLCRELGVPLPIVCQPYYNLLNRMPEVEILPACQHFGLGVVPYSPVARGVLTGKYLPGVEPEPGSRGARKDRRFMQAEYRQESLLVAQRLSARADELGVRLGQYATAWVLRNQSVSAVIAGPRTLAQWQEYAGALTLLLSAEDEKLVDSLVAPGHPSTPGYTDPAYPVSGRLLPG